LQAIGLIETKGLIASIESADVMLKAADVKLISKTLVGGGLVTITVEGDVAAVKASVDAAVSAVERLGMDLLISNHVIPRPVDSIRDLFDEKDKVYTETSCENIIEDDIIKQDELEEETVITESHEDEISESVEDESHEGEISEYTTEIRAQPLSADIEFPSDGNAIAHICFDETPQALPSVNPSYTVWQSKIVEYDCTGKQAIKMTFAEAMYNVIILSGALHNDFTLHLFFDKRSGNGAKQYQIVYKLTGNYTVTLTTDEKHTNKIAETIDENVFGSGCYVVVDFNGNVWRFKGGKGSAGGNFQNIDIAGTIDDADYFIIEKEKEIRKIEKPKTLEAVQQFDSPIGEIKAFFENDYKHGFLEANGLPFSPDVFPELTAYVKRVFNTGTEPITGWPLRPKLEGPMQGTKIFIKAVQGV